MNHDFGFWRTRATDAPSRRGRAAPPRGAGVRLAPGAGAASAPGRARAVPADRRVEPAAAGGTPDATCFSAAVHKSATGQCAQSGLRAVQV